MYSYRPQLPNMNTPVFVPRRGVSNLSAVTDIQVDRSFLFREDEHGYVSEYVPNGPDQVINSVWLSAVINSNVTKTAFPYITTNDLRRILGSTEMFFGDRCRSEGNQLDRGSVYEVVERLNRYTLADHWAFSLNRIDKWDHVLVALVEGYTVMVGGSVYESFSRAENGGIVPMPKPQEDLLGGQIVNLVAFDQKNRRGTLWGNRGETVGKRGLFFCHDSYLRNLNICRDFFVLIPRILHADHS